MVPPAGFRFFLLQFNVCVCLCRSSQSTYTNTNAYSNTNTNTNSDININEQGRTRVEVGGRDEGGCFSYLSTPLILLFHWSEKCSHFGAYQKLVIS